MRYSTANQQGQGTTRRAFLKQVFALTCVSASTALLSACGSSSVTATAVPAVGQQPTPLPTTAPAPTTAAPAGAVSTAVSGATPSSTATAGATTPTTDAKNAHIQSVTAITEVFGDGQKVTAVAVEYDKAIDNSKLSKSAFSVSDRTITNVYANTAPARASQGTSGKYVIVELSTDDANASTLSQTMGGGPSASGQTMGTPSANGTPEAQGGGGMGMSATRKEVNVSVTQTGELTTPGMNAITAALEQEGAKVSRATWSGQSTPAEFASDVSNMLAEDSNVNYAVLQKGTVVPAGQTDDGGSNHMNTWRIAYTIEGVRDWLFTQVKTTS